MNGDTIMLVGLLTTLFTIMCFFLVFIIFVQKGKGSMGLGSMGGGTQLIFGGSGGQDILQKVTWALVAVFLLGSLGLAIYKNKAQQQQRYITQQTARS